jgi:hypothetical protein
MAVRPIGGYDPNTDWPPDDSTGVSWQDDTALPGQFQGGGAGFGPGGFRGAPRLTAPASGPPPGISLSNGGAPATSGPDIVPPTNSTIPPGKQVGAWTNPFTEAHINPATGQPELLPQGGGGGLPRAIGRGFRRIPGIGQVLDLVSPSDELAAPTGVELPRTLGRHHSRLSSDYVTVRRGQFLG